MRISDWSSDVCSSDLVLLPFHRNTGPTLSAFNAWVVLKGMETLPLRAQRQSENALAVGQFLEGRVKKILHPGLASHPQHELAMRQMSGCGQLFSLYVGGVRKEAPGLLNALKLIYISNNFGYRPTIMQQPPRTD